MQCKGGEEEPGSPAAAGAVHLPVPPTPAPAGVREVVALLVPFLQPTPQAIANNLLYLYVKYHLELGFSKFVQYTQVHKSSLLAPSLRAV